MWHRKNRRSAKLHKVRGQELTAERTAKPDDVTKSKGESNEINISGLIVARHKVTETRSGRVGKKATFVANVRYDFRKYGVVGSLFIIFFFLVFMLGPSIALVLFALDNIAKSGNSDGEGASENGSSERGLGYIVLVGSLAYLLIVLKIMTKMPDFRLGKNEKSKKK